MMKKLLLLTVILCFSAFHVNAQENECAPTERYVYCQLIGTQKFMSKKVIIALDFGQETSYFNYKNSQLVDENNKRISFNSMIDALNYMGKDGWEFAQAYALTVGQQNVYHWLLKKNTSMFTAEEQAEMLDDINLRK